jgi:hypothetical protein
LQPVKFELKHEIENPGNPIDRLNFLEEGMASRTTTFKDGSQLEVGMFGFESVIGISALMGTKMSLNLPTVSPRCLRNNEFSHAFGSNTPPSKTRVERSVQLGLRCDTT